MANDLVTGAKPSFLKKMEVNDGAQFAVPSSGNASRVSLKGGRITLSHDGEDRELGTWAELIICDAAPGLTKMFFSQPYKETEETVLPDCWSEDGIAPSPTIQGPIASKCGGCPKNLWGSKITPNGKKAKACTDYKKVVVMEPGVALFYELRVPPGSLHEWSEYVKKASQKKVGLNQVVTRMTYDKNFILHFEPARWITEQDMKIMETNKDDIDAVLRNSSFEGDAPAPSVESKPERLSFPDPVPAPAPLTDNDQPVQPSLDSIDEMLQSF